MPKGAAHRHGAAAARWSGRNAEHLPLTGATKAEVTQVTGEGSAATSQSQGTCALGPKLLGPRASARRGDF